MKVGPSESRNQVQALKHLKRLRSKVSVVNVEEKASFEVSDEFQKDERKQTTEYVSKDCSHDVKTRNARVFSEEPKSNLSLVWVASGIRVA